jgi:hypothetical protein
MRSLLHVLIAVTALYTYPLFAQKVQVDVDKTVNFSSYRSYSWADGQIARNPLITQLIVNAIETELNGRGLTKTTDKPDLKISVMAAAGMDLQGVGPSWNNQSYRSWGGYGNPSALMNITTGTLLIDLIETKNNMSIFRGVSKQTLNSGVTGDPEADARSVKGNVQKAVSKIFNKYPIAKLK